MAVAMKLTNSTIDTDVTNRNRVAMTTNGPNFVEAPSQSEDMKLSSHSTLSSE